MNQERSEEFDPQVQAALAELQDTIARNYPTATFEVSRGHDELENIHMTAIVDVEDTDEVLDLVIHRVVELQVEQGIPIHVIPIRTPERVLAAMKARAEAGHMRPRRRVPLLGRSQALGR